MAVLSEADRREVWATFMREMSTEHQSLALTKPELRAAIDALDNYFNANAAAINALLPQPAQAVLTLPQKARMMTMVVHQRYLKAP